jgi:DMSO/TMAO reductase YedYZ molybdopterin-dependent catalytic subunit
MRPQAHNGAVQTKIDPQDPLLFRRSARAAGAVAAGAALLALFLVSRLAPGITFAPAALAQDIIRATPVAVSNFFIDHLGHLAQQILTIGVVLGALALGGEGLFRTAGDGRIRPGAAGVLLGVAAAAVAATGSAASLTGVIVASVAAACLYVVVARPAFDRLAHPQGTDEDKRRSLRTVAGYGIALLAGGGVVAWLASKLGGPNTSVSVAQAAVKVDAVRQGSFPTIPGLTPEVTPAADHYVVDVDIIDPRVEASSWKLSVTGLVENPLQLSFSDLQSQFDVVEEYAVLTCISNRVGGNLVGNSIWTGVRLRDVLTKAQVKPGVVDLVLRGYDSYLDSIPLERAMDPSVLLAIAQDRQPLRQEHGFPCRLRIPAIYGMKNVKWLQSIELVDHNFLGYWQSRGWNDTATVHTESRIDVAGQGGSAKRGQPTWIAGIAWAGDRGISKVEVTTDGGNAWHPAMLKDAIGPYAWRLWAYRWQPGKTGTAQVACRATDGAGTTQPPRHRDPYPAGATGYPEVQVTVD